MDRDDGELESGVTEKQQATLHPDLRSRFEYGRFPGVIPKPRLTPMRLLARLIQLCFVISLLLTIALSMSILESIFGIRSFPYPRPVRPDGPRYRTFQPPVYAPSTLRDAVPQICHSHNDYWRHTPLYAALALGCISIEADVFLRDQELYVAHQPWTISPGKTLRGMYLEPLYELLEQVNQGSSQHRSGPREGVFRVRPSQSLTLLIDTRDPADSIIPILAAQLKRLRRQSYLTTFNGTHLIPGPLTIILSGNVALEHITALPLPRDLFFDAPLHALETPDDPRTTFPHTEQAMPQLAKTPIPLPKHLMRYTYNPSNSLMASAHLAKALRLPRSELMHAALGAADVAILRRQLGQARARGLTLSRYWGTPRGPRVLRDEMWSVLLREGAGLIAVDDFEGVRVGAWARWLGGGMGGGLVQQQQRQGDEGGKVTGDHGRDRGVSANNNNTHVVKTPS